MNCNNEIIIRTVGKVSVEMPEVDQLRLRQLLEEVLYKYDVLPQEKSIISSDIQDKINMYIYVRKLDGLSKRTLETYYSELIKFAEYFHKPICNVNINDLRMYIAARCEDVKSSSVLSLFLNGLAMKNPL